VNMFSEHEYVRDCDCRECAIIGRDEAREILHRSEQALIAAWADAYWRTGTYGVTKGMSLEWARIKYRGEILRDWKDKDA
jgi:hypothetical protein